MENKTEQLLQTEPVRITTRKIGVLGEDKK